VRLQSYGGLGPAGMTVPAGEGPYRNRRRAWCDVTVLVSAVSMSRRTIGREVIVGGFEGSPGQLWPTTVVTGGGAWRTG
jgi:hypothetical protein